MCLILMQISSFFYSEMFPIFYLSLHKNREKSSILLEIIVYLNEMENIEKNEGPMGFCSSCCVCVW